MNINWKIIKLLGAVVVIVGIIFWAVTTILPQSYNGTALNFEVGNGAIVLTNPSEQSIPVQLIGTGIRGFSVSSDIENIPASSSRITSEGNITTQLLEFEVPTGSSEILVERRGTAVTFVASTSTDLEATSYPMTSESSRNVVLAVIAIIVGVLIYASRVVEHKWIDLLRGKNPASDDTLPSPVVAISAQGNAVRAFGDNRAK